MSNDVDQNGASDAGTDELRQQGLVSVDLVRPRRHLQLDGMSRSGPPPAPLYPTGVPYDPAYDDNVTNFCERARLGDAKP